MHCAERTHAQTPHAYRRSEVLTLEEYAGPQPNT